MSNRNDTPEEPERIAEQDLELSEDDAENVKGGGDIVITKPTDSTSPK